MKKVCMPTDSGFRDCPHCGKVATIQYYYEGNGAYDIYFCNDCFGLVYWYGDKVIKVGGEAYPMRDRGLKINYPRA